MLSAAIAVAFLTQNEFIQINWVWQILLWGLAFFLALEEYRYSRFLFLFDGSVFVMLSALCPALLPLGAAALISVALTELDFKQHLSPKFVVTLLVFLIILDIFLVIMLYPNILYLVRNFSVPAFVKETYGSNWVPVLGGGDFVLMGFLTILFSLKWYQSTVAYAAAVLSLLYFPAEVNMLPAVPFIMLSFCVAYLLSRVPKRAIPLVSGRGVAGLYWLASRRQNKGGGSDHGKPKAF